MRIYKSKSLNVEWSRTSTKRALLSYTAFMKVMRAATEGNKFIFSGCICTDIAIILIIQLLFPELFFGSDWYYTAVSILEILINFHF